MTDDVKNMTDEQLREKIAENFERAYPGYREGYFAEKFADTEPRSRLENIYGASLAVQSDCELATKLQDIFSPKSEQALTPEVEAQVDEKTAGILDWLDNLEVPERPEPTACVAPGSTPNNVDASKGQQRQ